MSDTDVSYFRFSLLLKEIDNMRVKPGVSTVAMALIQLDGMEEINERFGYLGGDKVLKEFAVRLGKVIGDSGSAFEITGTSFAFLIENPVHEGDAVASAEKVARVASEPVRIGTGNAIVQARMGLSILPEPAATAEELLRQCELALAVARKHEETYRVFTPSLIDNGEINKSWFDVDAAIEQGEFELHFQPQINLRTCRLVGAEALIRWQSPQAGTIPQSYSIPDITSSEGARKMLRFVMTTALAQSRNWIDSIPDFTVTVNLAQRHLIAPELVGAVENALEETGYPPDRLVLEFDEDLLFADEQTARVQLNELRTRGVRIAIGDFGAGRSRLVALKSLPFDRVKIGQSLIVPMPSSEIDRRLVASLVQLGHVLDREVIAEVVEDADIMQTLLSIGCDIGQGFHFSYPLPVDDFERKWVDRFDRVRSRTA
jgi:diguanylate cyclase (GGDEF)-like protein